MFYEEKVQTVKKVEQSGKKLCQKVEKEVFESQTRDKDIIDQAREDLLENDNSYKKAVKEMIEQVIQDMSKDNFFELITENSDYLLSFIEATEYLSEKNEHWSDYREANERFKDKYGFEFYYTGQCYDDYRNNHDLHKTVFITVDIQDSTKDYQKVAKNVEKFFNNLFDSHEMFNTPFYLDKGTKADAQVIVEDEEDGFSYKLNQHFGKNVTLNISDDDLASFLKEASRNCLTKTLIK